MIIEPSNYTYETMPDYTDAVDGAVEIPVTGEEMEIRYAHEVVYDEAHNLHLEIFTPFQMAHPERKKCGTFSACACGGIQAESIADVPNGRFFRRTGFFRCRHDRKERKT